MYTAELQQIDRRIERLKMIAKRLRAERRLAVLKAKQAELRQRKCEVASAGL